MTVFIDADGCPVVDITVRLSNESHVPCIIICDTSHIFEKPGAKTITVPTGNDSVDFTLVNMISPGDIVVTQDYGLAAMCLARRAMPISQNGMLYTDANIDGLLMQRYAAKKMRILGRRFKGKVKRTLAQNMMFETHFKRLLDEHNKVDY